MLPGESRGPDLSPQLDPAFAGEQLGLSALVRLERHAAGDGAGNLALAAPGSSAPPNLAATRAFSRRSFFREPSMPRVSGAEGAEKEGSFMLASERSDR
jgi:hypothetical protein